MSDKIEEYMRLFDSIFDTETIKNIKLDNFKLLKLIFKNLEENLYTPSPRYSVLRKKHLAICNKLEETFTPTQKEMFEKQWEICNEICAEENEQLFIFGYIVASELKSEIEMLKK